MPPFARFPFSLAAGKRHSVIHALAELGSLVMIFAPFYRMNKSVAVASINDIPNQGGLLVRVGPRRVAVFRVGDEFFAIDDTCPHKGAPLSRGTVVDGTIFCPLHGWGFALKTGVCVDCPGSSVRTYAVTVVDGQLRIEV